MNEQIQRDICKQYGSPFFQAGESNIAGLARNFQAGSTPIHGLRHPSSKNTSGWYIWAGDYSDADDFFEPVHIEHLKDICPQVLKFLGLAPGWRFLIAGDHVDVWHDASLLNVPSEN